MKIELDLKDDEIFILKSAINQVIVRNAEFICREFVHEQMKDKSKKENHILCAILTQLNKQTKRRITL